MTLLFDFARIRCDHKNLIAKNGEILFKGTLDHVGLILISLFIFPFFRFALYWYPIFLYTLSLSLFIFLGFEENERSQKGKKLLVRRGVNHNGLVTFYFSTLIHFWIYMTLHSVDSLFAFTLLQLCKTHGVVLLFEPWQEYFKTDTITEGKLIPLRVVKGKFDLFPLWSAEVLDLAANRIIH